MMATVQPQRALVIGLDPHGEAAAGLMRRGGVEVTLVGAGCEEALARVKRVGLVGEAGAVAGAGHDLVVVSPWVSWSDPLIVELLKREVEVISELELGYREALCLNLAVAGTNGKSSTTRMIERVLERAGRKAARAGDARMPLCAVTGESRDLDYVVLEVEVGQLEGVRHYRPAVAVLMNLALTRPERWGSMEALGRMTARLFGSQQCFDWAIVQSEALVFLGELGIELPSKVITFSANDAGADLWWDRGLLVSRLPGWSGPLLDMEKSRLVGRHHGENVMAALAVGHVLRVPLEEMVAVVSEVEVVEGCCERVAEGAGGVIYVNDGMSSNPEALRMGVESMPRGEKGGANVILIAGGDDEAYEFHDVGPVLSRRVKRVFAFGGVAERMRAAWSLFTPCAGVGSLLEAVQSAAEMAAVGDVVLFSPACSSGRLFPSPQSRGEVFRRMLSQVSPELRVLHRAGHDLEAEGGLDLRVDARGERTSAA